MRSNLFFSLNISIGYHILTILSRYTAICTTYIRFLLFVCMFFNFLFPVSSYFLSSFFLSLFHWHDTVAFGSIVLVSHSLVWHI